MASTIYIPLFEINDLQKKIMIFIEYWVHEKKTPTPQKEILIDLKSQGIKECAIIYGINALLNKGYIRRAYTISNKTFYVQLRKV